jgi:copper homeostasis protein
MAAPLSSRPLLEIIACSTEDCRLAEQGGADRIELCAAIELGGLTPSYGLAAQARKSCKLPLMAMVRPRSGGFAYTEHEMDAMYRDAQAFLALGIEGLVFGVITDDAKIDMAKNGRLIKAGEVAEKVLHRAFDLLADQFEGLEQAIDLGFTRILTSGGAASILEGADQFKRLMDAAKGRIELLPGGGIEASNLQEVLAKTGASQVHMTAFDIRPDLSTSKTERTFNTRSAPESGFRAVDLERVQGAVKALW